MRTLLSSRSIRRRCRRREMRDERCRRFSSRAVVHTRYEPTQLWGELKMRTRPRGPGRAEPRVRPGRVVRSEGPPFLRACQLTEPQHFLLLLWDGDPARAPHRDATRRNDDAPQMVNIYLLITGGTVVASLESILNHPSEVLNLLGDALPSVAVYFAQVRPCAGSVLPGRSIGRLVVSPVARFLVCGGAWHLRRGSSVGRSVRGNVAPAAATARSSPRGAAPGSRRAPQRLKRQERGSPLAARGSRLAARVRSSSPSRRS